jgi:hypothetical protein
MKSCAWLFFLAAIGSALSAGAEESAPVGVAPQAGQSCLGQPPAKGKSQQIFSSTPLILIADELERQGEAAFHLQYDVKAPECVLEAFDVGGLKATVLYTPWAKGLSTLEYRVRVDRPTGATEVLVLYSGMASLFSGAGMIFHVSEERDGVISWYAMFKEEPTYAAVRELVEKIVKGEARPLLAVRWPPGAKEGDILVYDNKRLKK